MSLREGRELIPTAKAFSAHHRCSRVWVSTELTSAELTGEWEHKLARMERGELSRAEFMKDIAAMAAHIVAQAKNHESDTVPGDFATLSTPCPKCGGVIKENYKKFQCQRCEFSLWKIVAGRQFETAEIETLLAQRQVGPLQGFRSRMGRAFAAIIRLNDQLEPEFDFGQARAEADGAEPVDFTGQESLGPCPKCGARVFEHGLSYVCERAVGPARTCDFRSGTIILQQAISRAEMQKLLDTGRTSLLRGFVSSRTRRKFSAFLVRGAKDGKVGFEFEARVPKATAAKKGSDDPAKDTAGEAKPAKAAATKKAAAKPTRAKKAVVS
jgi:DNA topoisomerase-3